VVTLEAATRSRCDRSRSTVTAPRVNAETDRILSTGTPFVSHCVTADLSTPSCAASAVPRPFAPLIHSCSSMAPVYMRLNNVVKWNLNAMRYRDGMHATRRKRRQFLLATRFGGGDRAALIAASGQTA